MKAAVKRQRPGDEYYFREGCYITEVSNSDDDPDVSIVRARVEPGITTRWHRLADTFERYYIISGEGRVDAGGLTSEPVSPGDIVLIPPLTRQRITNTGADDLIFLAICSPRFRDAAYEDVED